MTKKKKEEKELEWYEVSEFEDNIIQSAMAHAKKEFHKFLAEEFEWEDYHPLIRLEVRELRPGDMTLGKAYTLDEIQEYEEELLNELYDEPNHEHFKEPSERKEIQ